MGVSSLAACLAFRALMSAAPAPPTAWGGGGFGPHKPRRFKRSQRRK